LLIASGAAAILAHLYNWYLGPAIVWAIHAYRVDFFYQRIPAEELAKLPEHSLKAGTLLIVNMAAMLGGYYVVGYLVLALVTGWLVWKAVGFFKERRPGSFRERYSSGASLGVIYALMILALQLVMFSLMIARHRFIYDWIDHWYWYYTLPFLMTFLFGLALLLNALGCWGLPRWGRSRSDLRGDTGGAQEVSPLLAAVGRHGAPSQRFLCVLDHGHTLAAPPRGNSACGAVGGTRRIDEQPAAIHTGSAEPERPGCPVSFGSR